MKILFITARFPYPALKGDQVRAYHQLRSLGKRHRVTLLSFCDRHVSAAERAHLAAFCEELILVPIDGRAMVTALARNLFSPLPFQTLLFQTSAMKAAARVQLGRSFDIVHVQLARMAPLAIDGAIPAHVDLIDALSLNMARRAREERGPLAALAAHEADRMHRYERQICVRAASASVVSGVDRDAIGPFERLAVNGNGVDVDHFAFVRRGRRPNTLVFSGNMGYFPNVNAVTWFAREVLPLIRREIPSVSLTIVGTNPAREVRALAARDAGITVTGFVADVRPHLWAASVGIVPMRAGTGMQNKVVEAMAAGTPLVATPFALGGIAAVDGEHLLVGADATAFAAHTTGLLQNEARRDAIATAARAFVEHSYAWASTVGELEAIYRRAMGLAQHEPLAEHAFSQ